MRWRTMPRPVYRGGPAGAFGFLGQVAAPPPPPPGAAATILRLDTPPTLLTDFTIDSASANAISLSSTSTQRRVIS
ncbi:hypothetical protein B0A89_13080 [Paracoccus contaminans]|uniref:Uncharacterized protein n=1 Tax=Paracoccus contaminans TaxID=1945662 RepID=A0A1W6D005_9RHOB|nr:hypothetical protein B0A89_13080 [Paracoccus contaminans]